MSASVNGPPPPGRRFACKFCFVSHRLEGGLDYSDGKKMTLRVYQADADSPLPPDTTAAGAAEQTQAQAPSGAQP